LKLELKLLADIGLVGMPNAGKSSLLSVISAARPKIADYPFTTLEPNLGVVRVGKNEFVVADIPGLIEGASKGKGLGDEFLRHIERTQVLVYLLDISTENPLEDFKILQKELRNYDPLLLKKPQLIVINKIDLFSGKDLENELKKIKKLFSRKKLFFISTITKEGIKELLYEFARMVENSRKRLKVEKVEEIKVYKAEEYLKDNFQVIKKNGIFKVYGKAVERKALQTNWENEEAVAHFQHIMHRMGIDRALRRAGVKPGSLVEIAGIRFEWKESS